MAISNYVRPHLEVHQMLQVTQASTGGRLAACVVGANYALYRYGQEELKPNVFSASTKVIPFEFEQDPAFNYDVDLDSVAVDAEGLEASLASFENKMMADSRNVFGLRLPGGTLLASAESTDLDPALKGLSVSVGDIVYVTNADDVVRRRTVIGLLGKQTPAAIAAGESSNPATVLGTTIKASTDAAYTGRKNTAYVFQIVSAPAAASWDGVVLKVTDTAGVDTVQTITLDGEAPTGVVVGTKGLALDFVKPTDISAGDTFSFVCTAPAASTTEFDGVVLNALPLAATDDRETALAKVEFRKEYSGPIPSEDSSPAPWTATEEGVTINPGVSLYIPERTEEQYVPFVGGVGNLFVSYRVLVMPMEQEELFYLENDADVREAFGTISPENELAYACACALDGAAGRGIYALRTTGTDAEAFLAAVKTTEANSDVYSFAVISTDRLVQEVVVQFNNQMSQPEVKKWRRTILGVDSPGEYAAAVADGNGRILRASFLQDEDGEYTIVQFADDNDIDLKGIVVGAGTVAVRAGDKVRIVANGVDYKVAAVISDKELRLVSGPQSAISLNTPVEIWKADTTLNTAEYVTAQARAFNTRRALVVWCDGGRRAEAPQQISNVFLAAEIAGISSAVVPQQGITRTEIVSISSAKRMYMNYAQAELDNIAKEGVLIVTQDVKNGPCYIRHQLTTETDKGSLYYEDSCTRNIDNISYAMVDILERYIGRTNVTPTALRQIELEASNTLDAFTADSPDELIGPSLVNWDSLTVSQDKVFKDRVIINVNLYLPLPLNVIKLYEMAYIADVTISE